MLTPPYHFSIVACSLTSIDYASHNDILCRGAIPALRNLPFIKRFNLNTIVYLRKKALPRDDGLVKWAERRNIKLVWVNVEEMNEETLGIGKAEVGQVIKVRSLALLIVVQLLIL